MTGSEPDIETVGVSQEVAEGVLDAQPFSRLLGTRLLRFEPGVASLALEVQPAHLQQQGRVHGGVLAYLVDNAATFAGGSRLGADVVTGGMDVEYVAAAQGPWLTAHARVEHGTVAVAYCSVVVVESDRPDPAQGGVTGHVVAMGHGRVRRLR